LCYAPPPATASLRLPRLPAADGGALLTRAQQRMHTLRTVSLTERLSWGTGATSARYQLEEPNHLRILTAGGAETVITGATRYSRDAPGKPWKIEHDFPVTPAPAYVWDYFAPPTAPKIIGSQRIGGHPHPDRGLLRPQRRSAGVVSPVGRPGPTGPPRPDAHSRTLHGPHLPRLRRPHRDPATAAVSHPHQAWHRGRFQCGLSSGTTLTVSQRRYRNPT
jgi:hypothetical protein